MKRTVTVNSILDGWNPTQYLGTNGGVDCSIAIDPDLPNQSATRTGGLIAPVGYSAISGANVTSHVVAIINNPKNTLTYVVLSNGRLISYDSALGSETLIDTVAGGTASSAKYYNNYIYIFGTGASTDDVSRYGPLNNSPVLANAFWKTTLAKTALVNTTYPSLRSVSIPNHVGHVHGNNVMYFTDFKNGQGLIHSISTRRVTNEGDTDDVTIPSGYNVLDLPFGFYPTDITSIGTNLMIAGIYSTDTTVNQGKGAFILWDPTDVATFYLGPVFVEDPYITACHVANGQNYLFSGNAQSGMRLLRYIGGESVREEVYLEDSLPPFAGAVDSLGSRIIWGGFTVYPSVTGCVWAYRSKKADLNMGLHNIIRTTSAGATPIITALKYVLQADSITPRAVVAWRDASTRGIDAYSATASLNSKIRWFFNIGNKFNILKIRIPLGSTMTGSFAMVPTIELDDLSSTVTLATINSTNNPSARKAIFKQPDLIGCIGENNFALTLTITGTDPIRTLVPITIDYDYKEDEL